jgi:ribosomal protein S1
MAQVMESDEFSNYMSGVDALQPWRLDEGRCSARGREHRRSAGRHRAKSEGIIARNEVGDEPVAIGDEVEVVVLRPKTTMGPSRCLQAPCRLRKDLACGAQQAKDKNTDVEGWCASRLKAVLSSDLGVPAFVPASHVDTRNRSDLSRFVGRTIPVARDRN